MLTAVLSERLRQAGLPTRAIENWAWRSPADGIASAQMMSPEDRQVRFDRLRTLAANHGIELHVCACKNPDLAAASNCQIAGPAPAPLPMQGAPLLGMLEP